MEQFDPRLFLATAGEGRTVCRFTPDEVVFSQGDSSESLFYILDGEVKISVFAKNGKEAILGILGKNEFFGHHVLSGRERRSVTATAIAQCSIMRVDKPVMLRTLQQEAKFSEFFIAFLLRRGLRMQEDIIDHLFNSSERRLARALLLLANFSGHSEAEASISQISQETLADMIGTTRSRVSVFMNRFRRLGHVEYGGDRILVRRSLLTVLLED